MTNIAWYAIAEGLPKLGPFSSQSQATKKILDKDGMPLPGSFVWPIEASKAPLKATAKIDVIKADGTIKKAGNTVDSIQLPCDVVPRQRNYTTQSV